MSAEAKWVLWNDSMESALVAHHALEQALHGTDGPVRAAAILAWLKAVKVTASFLNEWRDSAETRLELGDSLGYMREITGDYLRAVFDILGNPEQMADRTIEMLAEGSAATENFTDDAAFMRLIGIKP